MVKGANVSVGNITISDNQFNSVEGERGNGGSGLGYHTFGGIPPRFKTEGQRKMWLKLRAKADAKENSEEND